MEGTEPETPAADRAFRAQWPAEYAAYVNKAAEHLRQNAIQAAKSCGESLESRSVQQLPLPDELEGEELRLFVEARSYGLGSALLSLLAIEIALKAYQILDNGKHTHVHHLGRLFDSLNSETKARLDKLVPELAETVANHPEGFVSVRYQFEELNVGESVKIPRLCDPLHAAASETVKALIAKLDAR